MASQYMRPSIHFAVLPGRPRANAEPAPHSPFYQVHRKTPRKTAWAPGENAATLFTAHIADQRSSRWPIVMSWDRCNASPAAMNPLRCVGRASNLL